MGTPAQGAPSAWVQLVPFVLVLGIFYFIILLPMKRKQQKVQAFLAALKVGDRVVTSGGIFGTITSVERRSPCSCRSPTRSASRSRAAPIVGYQGQEPVVEARRRADQSSQS